MDTCTNKFLKGFRNTIIVTTILIAPMSIKALLGPTGLDLEITSAVYNDILDTELGKPGKGFDKISFKQAWAADVNGLTKESFESCYNFSTGRKEIDPICFDVIKVMSSASGYLSQETTDALETEFKNEVSAILIRDEIKLYKDKLNSGDEGTTEKTFDDMKANQINLEQIQKMFPVTTTGLSMDAATFVAFKHMQCGIDNTYYSLKTGIECKLGRSMIMHHLYNHSITKSDYKNFDTITNIFEQN